MALLLYFNIAPAAALSATATDMAHFMIAHLQKGKYDNTRIFEEKAAELMYQQHFTHHPKIKMGKLPISLIPSMPKLAHSRS